MFYLINAGSEVEHMRNAVLRRWPRCETCRFAEPAHASRTIFAFATRDSNQTTSRIHECQTHLPLAAGR